jgi:hypothetical protein
MKNVRKKFAKMQDWRSFGGFNDNPVLTKLEFHAQDSQEPVEIHCACNVCGGEMDFFDVQQGFSIHTVVGYGSKHDGEIVDLHLCNNCFDHLVDSCRISPTREGIDW